MAHGLLRKPFCMSLGLEHGASGPYTVYVVLKLAILNSGLFKALGIELNQPSKKIPLGLGSFQFFSRVNTPVALQIFNLKFSPA